MKGFNKTKKHTKSRKGKDDAKTLREWIELGEFRIKKYKSGALYGRFKYHWNERRTDIRRLALQNHALLKKFKYKQGDNTK